MKEFCKKYWPYGVTILFWIICIIAACSCSRSLKKENERLREELAKAQQYVPLQRRTIRDTVEIITQKVVEVEKIKEVLTKEDKLLLKDLSMKVSDVESYQKMSNVIHDTVTLMVKDTSSNTLYYKDAWTEFEYQNRRLKYSVKDSIAVALKREYKHKFLWWRWGVKGYDVKVVNFNPHASIRYNTYVKAKKW